MVKKTIFILAGLAILYSGFLSRGFAQDAQSIWTIEVAGASGLKNTDWGPNGKSDPFVEVYVYPGGKKAGKTSVKNNTLNPVWNYEIKTSYPLGQKPIAFAFVIWDKDDLRDRFLGVARLDTPVPGVEYSLNLRRRMRLAQPEIPGTFSMPGTLRVKITKAAPLVRVPDIKGKTDAEAQNILRSAGLKPGRAGSVIVANKNKAGKVLSQRPLAGENASVGQRIYYYIGRIPTYAVPNVIGCTIPTARGILRPFKHIKITYKVPSVDTPRGKWMKIAEQFPAAGQGRFEADTEIKLVVLRPPEDFKIIIPDIIGDSPGDAANSLRNAKVPSIQWKRERTADRSKNNIVVDQFPPAGEEVSWKQNSPVSVTVGWYADGKSLYAAKPTELDAPFDVMFNKPGSAEYRLVEITNPGYLILQAKGGQCSNNITPMSSYYREANGWKKVNKRWYYLPSAQRVTPGKWVVQVEPEMSESTSEIPCSFELKFVDEFDPAEPNDTFEQAVEIKPDAELISGFIGAYDEEVYSFEIKSPGYLEVLKEKLPSELVDKDLVVSYGLFNAAKESIGSYYIPSANRLEPGKYYIDFSAQENSWSLTRYRFTLRFHKAQDVGEPNDTKKTAYNLAAGKSIPVAYSMNDEDFYLITSDSPGYVVLDHDRDVPFDVNFNRYDEKGNVYGRHTELPSAVRIDHEKLVSLNAVSEGHGYLIDPPVMLQTGFISADEDIYEPNDTPRQAPYIELNKTIKGLLLPRFDIDDYRFKVNNAGRIFFDFVKPEGVNIPVKGKILSSGGKTVVFDSIFLPCEVNIKKAGEYILSFEQEPGFKRVCTKQYKLTIRDGKTENLRNNRIPSSRYGTGGNSKCIDSAKQAYQYLLSSKYQDANDMYSRAVRCLPDNEVIWNDYGVSFFRLKQYKKAKEALNKAIALNSKYALAYRNLAVIAWQGKDDSAGRDMAEKAASLDPSDENLRYAAHAYIILSGHQTGEEKKKSLRMAAEYYRRIKNISEASQHNLSIIENSL